MMQPLRDKVLVRRAPAEDRVGSIVIPERVKEKPQVGTVVAVGPGIPGPTGGPQPLDVVVGQTVMFAKYAGQDIVIDGESLLLLREDEILGTLAQE